MITSNNTKTIHTSNLLELLNTDSKCIIFWDACAILDILNNIVHLNNAAFLEVLIDLNKLIDQKKIISCSSVVVKTEVIDNYFNTPYKQAKKFLEDTIKNFNTIKKYRYVLKLNDDAEDVAINIHDILMIVERQIQQLFDNTYFLDDEQFLRSATNRVLSKKAPSNRGEYKDSIIWETCIEVSKITPTIDTYFISSNDKDYGKAGQKFPIIKNEIELYKINFKNNIIELYKLVKNLK